MSENQKKNFVYFLNKTKLFKTGFIPEQLTRYSQQESDRIKSVLKTKKASNRNFIEVKNGLIDVSVNSPLRCIKGAAYILIINIFKRRLPEGHLYFELSRNTQITTPLNELIAEYDREKNPNLLLNKTFEILSNVNGVYFTASINGSLIITGNSEIDLYSSISIVHATQLKKDKTTSFTGPLFKHGPVQFIENSSEVDFEASGLSFQVIPRDKCQYLLQKQQFEDLFIFAKDEEGILYKDKEHDGQFAINYQVMNKKTYQLGQKDYALNDSLLTCKYEYFTGILVSRLVKLNELTLNNLINSFICLWNIEHRFHAEQLKDLLFNEQLSCQNVFDLFAKKLQIFYTIYKTFSATVDLSYVTIIPTTFYVKPVYVNKMFNVCLKEDEEQKEHPAPWNLDSIKAYEKNFYFPEPGSADMNATNPEEMEEHLEEVDLVKTELIIEIIPESEVIEGSEPSQGKKNQLSG